MKSIVLVVSLPVVILLGVSVALMDLARSRAQAAAYGPQFATPLWQVLLQGAVIPILAIVLIAVLVVLERRRAARAPRRRRRRSDGSPSRVSAPVAVIALEQPALIEPAGDLGIRSLVDELLAPPRAVVLPREVPPAARRIADPLRHWGLREPAFENAPSTRFFYLSPAHTEALFRLRYAVHHRKGCAVLTGTYGCGKTTLTHALVRELDAARFDVALITNPLTTPNDLLREILHQLGVEAPSADKPALVHALENRLAENLERGRHTVVIVDEAELIEDDAVFNELRLLLNFQTNDRSLISLVLCGSDELLETLRRQPHLAQRCAVRAALEPLDRGQTGQYVRHRLVVAGRVAEALTEEAVDELFDATGGTPRVINAVCDLTLLVGAAAGVDRVDAELVRLVAEDVTSIAA